MSALIAIKDPDSDLDYSLNWTDWLRGAELIATSTWTLTPSGLTAHSDGIDTSQKYTTVWLAGGTPGVGYTAVNHVITNAIPPRSDDRSLRIIVRQR